MIPNTSSSSFDTQPNASTWNRTAQQRPQLQLSSMAPVYDDNIRCYDDQVQVKREDIEGLNLQRSFSGNSYSKDSGIALETNSVASSHLFFDKMEDDDAANSFMFSSQGGSMSMSSEMDYTGSPTLMSPSYNLQNAPYQYAYPSHSPIQGRSSLGYDNNIASYTSMDEPSQQSAPEHPKKFVCLAPNCTSKAFGRSADLDRHQKQVHNHHDSKDKFYCDYNKCQRKDGAFGRKDHFRDHFRDYHKEDILQRGKNATTKWFEERNIKPQWFRCSKCLRRVVIKEDGWDCPSCHYLCEQERKRYREGSGKQRR